VAHRLSVGSPGTQGRNRGIFGHKFRALKMGCAKGGIAGRAPELYSLAGEAVSISAPALDLGWTLSLHTPHGDNFYVIPGQQLRTTDLSLVIVPGAEKSGELMPATRRAPTPSEDQIASPSEEGLIVIRAPLKGLAWKGEAEAALARAKCTSGVKS
jgi:uncharacterized membrane protein